MQENNEGYTRKQILREETEAPFRQVRQFLYISLLAAAVLGLFISGSGYLATSSGARPGDLSELGQNTAINAAGIPVISYLWRRDLKDKDKRLARIKAGGALAALQVKIPDDEGKTMLAKLSDFRRDRGMPRRVVIVSAPGELLVSSLQSAMAEMENLFMADILIVPVEIVKGDARANESFGLRTLGLEDTLGLESEALKEVRHIATPVAFTAWDEVIRRELETALTQTPDALDKGVTLIIKKNGRVGTRRFGVPLWEGLVDDVSAREGAGLDVSNI